MQFLINPVSSLSGVNAKNELYSKKKLTLAWVPSHKGVNDNEAADDLVRQGSSRTFVGPSFGNVKLQMENCGRDYQDKDRKESS